MSSIYDNIEQPILPELQAYLKQAYRADFCVGYFNLRGWRQIDADIEKFEGGDGQACRLLVGMYRLPKEELREALAIGVDSKRMSNEPAKRLENLMAQEFRQQLTYGAPTADDEEGLQRLRSQLLAHKLQVKLFLRHPLHAKLYLIYRRARATPIISYVGSSNLTLSGLRSQGELNVEVVDRDDTNKLEQWFEERWDDRFCLDISEQLAEIIDESWAGRSLKPYFVYLKMAYHLSQEARDELSQYRAPASFGLLPFQEAAVQVAAKKLNSRGGVVIGDVVGLGKTLVGTAIAHLCEEDYGTSTLIICPKNLEKMWQGYIDRYGLRGKVVPISRAVQELPNVPARFRLVLIDESHNLRNKEGKRYQAIKDYIEQSGSRCILLTATPYNKTYLDLSAQLQLFLRPDADLGIKPEAYIRSIGGEMQFRRRHSTSPVRSLLAFEQSPEPEDWQQLMSRYMVRRTRSFIKNTYAEQDGERYYLEFADGRRSYFPARRPRTVRFSIGEPQTVRDSGTKSDPYARLYADRVVDVINALNLPRYGLGLYIAPLPSPIASAEEEQLLANLSHAGQRLMGFCRTNLFKRLESSGAAFIQSLERHILRNYVYLHAIAHDLPLPIGTQDAALLDEVGNDEDEDSLLSQDWEEDPHPLAPSPKAGEGEPEHSLTPLSLSGRGAGGEGLKPRYEYFRKVLAEMEKHPNPRYLVLKSIMLNNLYGVDIMEEATEICKLRLFLKLVAQMEAQPKKDNFGLEPLPDIDFNIRAGNTLVGFVSLDEVRKAIKQDGDQLKLDFQNDASRIDEKAELADRAFQRFRQMQTEFGMNAIDFRGAKKELRRRLGELNDELNRYLAREYGVDADKPAVFEKWRESHQPFHWFIEFYSIIDRGGFDVIIGNPPYLENTKLKSQYSINGYSTFQCGNVYACVLEKAYDLLSKVGRSGFIVPLSLVCTKRTALLRSIVIPKRTWISCFDMRPSSLFEGIAQRLSIILAGNRYSDNSSAGGYRRWTADERNCLIEATVYTSINLQETPENIAKFSSDLESKILKKISGESLEKFIHERSEPIYVHRIVRYFVKALSFIPLFIAADGTQGKSDDYKKFCFLESERAVIIAILNSSLFYWFWRTHSDGFHCGFNDVYLMPYNQRIEPEIRANLSSLSKDLIEAWKTSSSIKKISTQKGEIQYQEFSPKSAKPIIDEIDRVLAQHYGFTAEELDFIINYDIKYRMGRDNGGDD